jgi:hypothetical protein
MAKLRLLHFRVFGSSTIGYFYLTEHRDSDADDFSTKDYELIADVEDSIGYPGMVLDTPLHYNKEENSHG